ncbi:MAG: TetR/AcrR family transcriptional regulator [Kiloniellales bacterium]
MDHPRPSTTRPHRATRRRRSGKTHEAILRAAARLVAEQGYNRTTIEAIARLAGAGKQTVYRWWPSKAALFMELYRSLAPRPALAVDTGSVAGDLEEILGRVLRAYAEMPAKAVLGGLIAEAQCDPEVADGFGKQIVLQRSGPLRRVLERGITRGELRPHVDLDLAVDTIAGAVWFRLLLGPAPPDQAFAHSLVEQLLHGLAEG